MKTNRICGNCSKDISQTHKNRKYCINCSKDVFLKQRMIWAKNNLEKVRKAQREFRKRNLDSERARIKEYALTHKEKRRQYAKKDRMKHDLKYKVRSLTNRLFQKKTFCEECGETNNLTFHHLVYNLPVQEKDVQTLCTKCHAEVHSL